MIHLCIQSWAYHRRLWWMLSSIVQQRKKVPLKISVYLFPDDPFVELAKRMVKIFNCLKLNVIWVNDKKLYKRGNLRTHCLKNTDWPWVIFLDCDCVFHPEFFDDLLRTIGTLNKPLVYGCTRTRLTQQQGEDLVNNEIYDGIISDSYDKCSIVRLKNKLICRPIGYFQMVNVNHVPNRLYSPENRRDDAYGSFKGKQYQSNSDFYLRSILGGMVVKALPMYHLNHWREHDKENNSEVSK